MSLAVRFDRYGGPDVLHVVDVEPPVPGPGQVLVRVRAAGLNLGEAKIRQGLLHERFPATFPSGQGSDLAGVVEAVGSDVTSVREGDEVAGFTDDRASHAELVLVDEGNLTPKPASVPWEVAGSLFVAGTTAYATVRAVGARSGDTIVVAGAAGGVGGTACQLALAAGARVVGIASSADHGWLTSIGVEPVGSDGDVATRLRAVAPWIDGFIDTVGHGYVRTAVELGVAPERIDTIIDFGAVEEFGVKAEAGTAAVLAELLDLVDRGDLEVPVAATFPLTEVREAFTFLEAKHGRGKVVLVN
jgi:NADPH:quinone reductase-like Zn-dependent oxidoreductase